MLSVYWHAVGMTDGVRADPASRRADAEIDTAESPAFARGVSLFDAVYGFAMTLLIANVDPPPAEAWQSVQTLLSSHAGTQLLGFGLSFLVIAVIWRSNVTLMRRLSGIDGPVTALNLLTSGLVILIAFTTQGISDPESTGLPLSTALYALNIAAVSLTQIVMYQVARARGLEQPRRSDRQNRREIIGAVVTPLVFLASVPVAVFIDADIAKLTWVSLVILNPVTGLLLRRRTESDGQSVRRRGAERRR